MYDATAAPQYIPGGTANAVVCLLVIMVALVLRFVHQRENKKLVKAEEDLAHGGGAASTGGTRVAPGFRYVY